MQIIRKLNMALFLCSIFSLTHAEANTLRLAITTTTENSGLMSLLNPVFEKEHRVKINIITTSSSQALRLGEQGDVDVLLTHVPEDEAQFISAGHGIKRYPVMHNDFILLGPANDPANTMRANSIFDAFNNIYTAGSQFISRGDNSGTHQKELLLWQDNNLWPKPDWYVQAGAGMASVLLLADDMQAYTLTDRGTYLAFKDKINLTIQYQGDAVLYNPYHVIAVNPKRHSHVNNRLAEQYIKFLTGAKAQAIIKKPLINAIICDNTASRHAKRYFSKR